MKDDEESDDEFWGPNAGAYELTETRSGPPLDYVAEKLRRALEELHGWLSGAGREEGSAQHGFYNGLVAYLALKNFLGLVRDPKLVERLAGYSRDDFSDWLDRVDAEGSVRG